MRRYSTMIEKVLRRHQFWQQRNGEQKIYMKHSTSLGGIYVIVRRTKALVWIPELRICKEFTRASQLERFLSTIENRIEVLA